MSYVRYIDKTREYYAAEGYGTPYQWARFDTIPFTPFAAVGKLLARCRVGVATSSEMARRGLAAEEPDPRRLVYALPTDILVEDLYSRKTAYDRYATTLDDVDSYLPLTHLHRLVAEGELGALAPRFQVIHSEYSQRKTLTIDAPEMLRQMREDRVDVAVLTAV